MEHPLFRTLDALKNDIKKLKQRITLSKEEQELEDNTEGRIPFEFPLHCDVLVIGGGAIGSSIAYWLKKRALEGLRVVVIEKDPTASIRNGLRVTRISRLLENCRKSIKVIVI